MSIRKLLLLSSMALAVVAFAVPASASASQWRHSGVPITGTVHLSSTGTLQFNSILGGIHCQSATIDLSLKNEGGVAKGALTSVTADPSADCHGSGSADGCEVLESEMTSPAAIEVDPNNAGSITITDISVWTQFRNTTPEECAVEELEFHYPTAAGQYWTVSFHRNAGGGITNLTIASPSGGILTAFGLEIEGIETEANFTVNAPSSGTYQLS